MAGCSSTRAALAALGLLLVVIFALTTSSTHRLDMVRMSTRATSSCTATPRTTRSRVLATKDRSSRRDFGNLAVALAVTGAGCVVDGRSVQGATSYAERSGLSGQSNRDTAQYKQLASGLRYLDAKIGSGPGVEKGDTVVLEASGRLAGFNGQIFFKATGDEREPLEFQVGTGLAIPGIEQGVIGMQKGGIRRLIIPGELGYPRPCSYDALGKPGAYPDPGSLRYRQLLFAVVNNDAREDTLVVDVKVELIRKG
ncbi:hypothetical protein AAMO2058_001620400 [Amorphochlora amoebiformis]